jgi:hypothetical protein
MVDSGMMFLPGGKIYIAPNSQAARLVAKTNPAVIGKIVSVTELNKKPPVATTPIPAVAQAVSALRPMVQLLAPLPTVQLRPPDAVLPAPSVPSVQVQPAASTVPAPIQSVVSPVSVPAALTPQLNLTTTPASPMPGDTASSGLYYNGSTTLTPTPTPAPAAGGSSSGLWLVAAAGLLFLFAPRGH